MARTYAGNRRRARRNIKGFKENVIMGHLIPVGTSFHYHHRDSEFEFTVEEPEAIIEAPEILEDEEDVIFA